MYIFYPFFIGSTYIHFFEVMDTDLKISSDNLDIDDDLLRFCSCQCVPIFLVGHNSIRKHLIGAQLNLIVFRLRVQCELGFFFCCYFDEKDTFGTGFI